MDRFDWLWLLGAINAVSLFLLVCRIVWLNRQLTTVRSTVTYLVFCHRAHTHDADMHLPKDTAQGCHHAPIVARESDALHDWYAAQDEEAQ